MCEQMVKFSTKVMSNVFDEVKELVEKSESNIQDLTNRLNEAVSNMEQYKTQKELEMKETKEKSENLSDDI
jgi:predicted  nucleic acid-binding Zn-ribbon protein